MLWARQTFVVGFASCVLTVLEMVIHSIQSNRFRDGQHPCRPQTRPPHMMVQLFQSCDTPKCSCVCPAVHHLRPPALQLRLLERPLFALVRSLKRVLGFGHFSCGNAGQVRIALFPGGQCRESSRPDCVFDPIYKGFAKTRVKLHHEKPDHITWLTADYVDDSE